MLKYVKGDLLKSPAQVLVNAVNTVGVMGKGIASQFKNKYPEMFKEYRSLCNAGNFKIGELLLFYEKDHWIMLFPTKKHWRNPSNLSYIEDGLKKFVEVYDGLNITSIAFPKLGCGNGGLDWNDVRPLMEKYLKPLPIDVYIYIGVNSIYLPEHLQKNLTDGSNDNFRSFSVFCENISNHVNTLIPIELNAYGITYKVTYNEELVFTSTADEVKLDNEELFDLWELLANNQILKLNKNKKEYLFIKLLNKIGYLDWVEYLTNSESQSAFGVFKK